MSKKENKKPKIINPLSDKSIENLKKNFDFGNGVEFLEGTRKSENDELEYTHYFSSKLPKLEVKTPVGKRFIDVEVSSVDESDRKLLHFLHSGIN